MFNDLGKEVASIFLIRVFCVGKKYKNKCNRMDLLPIMWYTNYSKHGF